MKRALLLEPITASNSAFVVPDDDVAGLGGGGRPKVVVTVEGVTWRTSLARMNGRYLLGLTKAQYAETGVASGQTYDIEIALDTAPRVVEVPADLAVELAADDARRAAWQGWSYTRQKEAARSLTEAKQAATRERRLAKIVTDLASL